MPAAASSQDVRVSVVIAARDAERTLGATLDCLDRQTFAGGYEVIVVDNGSHDATAAVAESHGARVIRRERGQGPGSARNEGVRAACGELIAFTDSDCEPVDGWLEAGVAAMDGADLVQGRVEPAGPANPFDRTLWVTRAWGLFETANIFVRRSLFTELGGFGAGLEADSPGVVGLARSGAPFGEDALFGARAIRAGARHEFCDDALVRHEVVGRNGRDWLRERRRDGLFPGLVKEVPELRSSFLFARLFLAARNAAFATAAVGILLALCTQLWWIAVAAVPWLARVARDAAVMGVRNAAVTALGDVVSVFSTLTGSIKARTLVI